MKAKKVCKKVLSVIMALTLVLTTFVCFDIGSLLGTAVDTSSAVTVSDNNVSNVYFYAPEQIYLEPSLTGYTAQAKYKYQWFVDSTVDASTNLQTLRTGENSTGNFYFYYENASQVSISYNYLKSDMTAMTAYTNTSSSTTTADYANANCTIKLAAYSTPLRASETSGVASYIYYTVAGNKIDTTITRESESPYLLAATKGYYIEWKATFVDKLDGQTKVAYAYTYVYKPCIQPVGVAQRSKNTSGSSHFGQSISWISGINSFSETGTYYPNSATGTNNLVTFASSNENGFKLGEVSSSFYTQFATEVVENGYFKYTASNQGSIEWFNSDGGSSPYTKAKSFTYQDTSTGGSWHSYSVYNLMTAPTSSLFVDVSRYSNMSQIPNLSGGLMVTDDDSSDKSGAWYVADGTGKDDSSTSDSGKEQSKTDTASAYYYNYKSIIANQGDFDNRGNYEYEGVKYN